MLLQNDADTLRIPQLDQAGHTAAARELYATIPNLLEVLDELVAHALRAEPVAGRHMLETACAMVHSSGNREDRDRLEAALHAFGEPSPTAAWLAREVARLRVLGRDPIEQIVPAHRAALDGTFGCDDVQRAARSAMMVHFVVKHVEPDWFRDRARELDPSGWGRYLDVAADPHDVGPQRDADVTEMLGHAAHHADASLAARNAGTVAWHHWLRAELADSEAWYRRAMVEAELSGDFSARLDFCRSLVWLLIDDLRLVEAREYFGRIVQVIEDQGFVTQRPLTLLLAADLSALSGQRQDLDQLLGARGWTSGMDPFEWLERPIEGWLNPYVAVRRLDAFSALGHPGAIRALDAARTVDMDEHDNQRVLLLVSTCRVEPDSDAWRGIPAALVGADTLSAGQALLWLAHHAALSGDADVLHALRDALGATADGRSARLDLARSEATAVLNGDWRALLHASSVLQEAGFESAAAMTRASAATIAARAGHGAEAQRHFDIAHQMLARMGYGHELARVRRARAEHGSAQLLRSRSSSDVGLLDVLELDPAVRTPASEYVVRRMIPNGERFPVEFVCAVVSGMATLDRGDTDAPIDLVGAGDVVHVERALDDRADALRAQALTPCVVDAVPVEVLALEAARSPALALALGRWSLARAERECARAWEAARDPLETRLSALLVDLTERVGTDGADGTRDVAVPRATLARLVGASREATSRTLSALAAKGAIELTGRTISVRQLSDC
jgi:CRP-like cAMP-binding protein